MLHASSIPLISKIFLFCLLCLHVSFFLSPISTANFIQAACFAAAMRKIIWMIMITVKAVKSSHWSCVYSIAFQGWEEPVTKFRRGSSNLWSWQVKREGSFWLILWAQVLFSDLKVVSTAADDPARLLCAAPARVSKRVKYCGTSVNHRLHVRDRGWQWWKQLWKRITGVFG